MYAWKDKAKIFKMLRKKKKKTGQIHVQVWKKRHLISLMFSGIFPLNVTYWQWGELLETNKKTQFLG